MNTNVFNSFRARILAGGAALLAVLVLGLALSLSGGLVRAQDSTIEYAENGKDPVATFTADDPEGSTSITWDLLASTAADPTGIDSDVDSADADHFDINEDGELTFDIGATAIPGTRVCPLTTRRPGERPCLMAPLRKPRTPTRWW